MLVELQIILDDLNAQLTETLDERDQFVLANEDILNEFLYNKKLREFDDRIAHLRSEIIAFDAEYRQALRSNR